MTNPNFGAEFPQYGNYMGYQEFACMDFVQTEDGFCDFP
jgi:hypothetical protein